MQPADIDPICPRCGRTDCSVYPAFVAAAVRLYQHFGSANARGLAESTIRTLNSVPEPARDATD